MKSFVIGITGVKNSGKDTVASMINYMFTVGVTKANYQNWMIKKNAYDIQNEDRIIHFADPLKDALSVIYNIPRLYFDDRKYKDELWYCFEYNSFIEIDLKRNEHYNVIDINSFTDNISLHDILENHKEINNVIKLRTLMQYFGTNICRDKLSDDIWIKCAINRIVTKASSRRLCIVPDVRFANEVEALRNNQPSLYGEVIEVRRQGIGSIDNHESERIDFDVDTIIENDGTKMLLFYKVLSYVEHIINTKL